MDWPVVAKDVKDLCALCPICQKAGPAIIVKAPLNPLKGTLYQDSHGCVRATEQNQGR